jgi:AraC family transcriptional regulator, regulatory protein of adaptative response / DNA-3-methyladenine glycosylase II
VPPLDPDHCYAAVCSRDVRFDGWFVTAVRTTGIYCRPSCPAITPKRANVEFHPTAASAQQRGFRACKRCRPDASPGSPEWNARNDVVARCMRLIADGVIERDGVAGLARRLGYSERHLNRLVTEEIGAGPLAVARAQRAHTARLLIETSTMPLVEVAFAAGFGSARQFNDTVREVFGVSPTALRQARRPVTGAVVRRAGSGPALAMTVRLAVRQPFDGACVLAFLGSRAIPGVESWDGNAYRRSLDLPGGHGLVTVRARSDGIDAHFDLASSADLAPAVQRVRRLLDLDGDPVAVDETLCRDRVLAPLIRRSPGRRAPASVDAFESVVRAVIGQQVSVAGARTVAGRLVSALGAPLAVAVGPTLDGTGPGVEVPDASVTHVFPNPTQFVVAPDDLFAMPASRRDTIRRVAAATAGGDLDLHVGVDPDAAHRQLLGFRGIGPWTADYVVMRGLGHPDVFLTHDLGVRHALDRLGLDASVAPRWSPWRSYAVHHLWSSLAPTPPVPRKAPS